MEHMERWNGDIVRKQGGKYAEAWRPSRSLQGIRWLFWLFYSPLVIDNAGTEGLAL